jgi:prophage regulatory protein
MSEQNNAVPKRKIIMLKLAEVKARTKLSAPTIYRFISLKKFPRPVKLGDFSAAWISSEIDDWLEERRAARDRETQEELAREEMVRKSLEENNAAAMQRNTLNPLLASKAPENI